MAEKLYRDETWLREQYHDNGRTMKDMAGECDVTSTTIGDWMDRNGIERRDQIEAQQPDAEYTDEGWLRGQYQGEERSLHDIGAECGVSGAVILKWMRRFGIERRGTGEHLESDHITRQTEYGDIGGLPGGWVRYGCKIPNENDRQFRAVKEHQLVAIAEGADPHKVFSGGEYHVHHKNGIRWDNRAENLELVERENHLREHNDGRERTPTGEWA